TGAGPPASSARSDATSARSPASGATPPASGATPRAAGAASPASGAALDVGYRALDARVFPWIRGVSAENRAILVSFASSPIALAPRQEQSRPRPPRHPRPVRLSKGRLAMPVLPKTRDAMIEWLSQRIDAWEADPAALGLSAGQVETARA